jgi:intracellular multiplication protein IcmV
MGAFQVIKKGVAAGWNFSGWVGSKNIRQNALLIKDLSKAAFTPGREQAESAPKKETFAQAMQRLNITEAGLQKRIRASTQVIYFCGVLVIPMLAYTFYMFKSGFYLSTFVCLMLTLLLGAYTFREHFNRYQMRRRKLGCTMAEWFRGTFLASPRKK